MAAENILALLAGRDSKTPMGFDELVAASGMDAIGLESELEQMCHWLPAPINCAQITRSGKTQMFYWPTGVVEKAERQHITINPRKLPPSGSLHRPMPVPRRSEIMPAQPKQETPMQAKEEGKSNARVMLEYLAENGTATGQELCQLCEVESVGSYLGGPIKRGHLLVEKLGQTSRSGNRYTVAPGVTRDELLADGRKKNVPPHKQTASEKPSIPVIVAQPAAEIAQPETEILPVPEDAPIEVPALVSGTIELRACTLQTLIEQLQAMLPADITLVVGRSVCDIEHSSGSFNGTASDAQRTIDAIVWLYGDKNVAEQDLESVECA